MSLFDLIDHRPVLDDVLLVLIWIVAIPAVTFGSVAHLNFADHFVLTEVFAGPLGSDLARTLYARLSSVSDGSTVGAGSFTVFGYL